MKTSSRIRAPESEAPLLVLFRAIASGDGSAALRMLADSPELARRASAVGATRREAEKYYLETGYVYAGHTALHVAAAAYRRDLAEVLVANGAGLEARNRRGATPLHQASVGVPGAPTWNPAAQRKTIAYLIEAGADPDAVDKEGATALHRAVRTRCGAAVGELLAKGADPVARNRSGSTPLHLAVQDTGRGGTGSSAAREEQAAIILLLLDHGARLSDKNGGGKTVEQSISSDWIRVLVQRR
jgi:hypothetical protein